MTDRAHGHGRKGGASSVVRRLRPIVVALVLGVAGLVAGSAVGLATAAALSVAGLAVLEDPALLIAVAVPGQAVGFAAVTYGYLRRRGLGVGYLRIRRPTLRDALWSAGGLVVLFAALAGVGAAMTALGVGSPAEHEIVGIGLEHPGVLLVLVAMSVVFIGPGEELLFRGAVQTRLVGAYGTRPGIAATSAVFAVVHFPAYATGTAGEVGTSLAVVFALSLVLGWVYERTDNLLVPAAVHGVYNAALFGLLYLTATTDLVAA